MKKQIIPSIIAENQKDLDKRISKVKDFFSILQLDIMDGKFVENKSFDFEFELPREGLKYEAQLMVNDPINWIEHYGNKVNTIIFHIESGRKDARKIIKLIRSK